jgi:hypothetical protein
MISPGGLVATLFKSTGAAVAAAVDATFAYVSLHLNGEPPVGTSTFLSDASTNALAVTPVGSVRSDNFSPFAGDGYYGVQFNGTTDTLTTPVISGFGSNNFTIEAWINPAVLGIYQTIWCNSNGADDLGIQLGLSNGNKIGASGTFTSIMYSVASISAYLIAALLAQSCSPTL